MTVRCFLMIAACLSCLGCRAADPSNSQDPAPVANDPPTARAQVQSAAADTVVFAYYFHRTQRCPSCLLLETTAARAIQEHFARQIQDGQVIWASIDIEDPENEPIRRQFEVRINGLVLVRMDNGAYKDAKRLDELWGLLGRPDAFSKYLIDEINARLSPVRGGGDDSADRKDR